MVVKLRIVFVPLGLILVVASCQATRTSTGWVVDNDKENRLVIQMNPPPGSMASIAGQEFVVRPDTAVTLDGRPTRLIDLPPGVPVVVKYDPQSNIARSIRASRSKSD